MKDYTEIFSKAIELSSGYRVENIADIINSTDDNYCQERDDWGEYNWYYLAKADKSDIPINVGYLSEEDIDDMILYTYGYLSCYYPVALIKENCPEIIRRILAENNILFTELEEPMRCNEDILRKYVDRRVIDESAFLNGNFSFDDERFELILDRIETGYSCYIDASNFIFDDIQNE